MFATFFADSHPVTEVMDHLHAVTHFGAGGRPRGQQWTSAVLEQCSRLTETRRANWTRAACVKPSPRAPQVSACAGMVARPISPSRPWPTRTRRR
jgi:hypothetical protein